MNDKRRRAEMQRTSLYLRNARHWTIEKNFRFNKARKFHQLSQQALSLPKELRMRLLRRSRPQVPITGQISINEKTRVKKRAESSRAVWCERKGLTSLSIKQLCRNQLSLIVVNSTKSTIIWQASFLEKDSRRESWMVGAQLNDSTSINRCEALYSLCNHTKTTETYQLVSRMPRPTSTLNDLKISLLREVMAE